MSNLYGPLLVLTLVIGTIAHADLLAEPYIAYETGNITATTKSGSPPNENGKTSMIDIGGRLGYQFPFGLWIAADLLAGFSGKYTPSNGVTTEAETTRGEYGVTAGFSLPMGLRFYAGYILNEAWSETQTVGSLSVSGVAKEATGYKGGVGFKVAPKFALNVEYYTWTPKKFEALGVTEDISASYTTWTESGYRLVLSIPL